MDEPVAPAVPLSRGGTSLCRWQDWQECERRCDAGNALSCARLAHRLRDGLKGGLLHESFEPDLPRARELYRRACDGGYAPGCNALAVMLADALGGPADQGAANKLYKTACDRGVAAGCANLGTTATNANDPARARRFYKQACELGDAESCIDATDDSDVKGTLRSMRRALHGAPVASPAAAAVLACPQGTIATMTASGAGGLAGPTMYCALPTGKRHGPYIEWLGDEDLAEGSPHGVMSEQGSYVDGALHGPYTSWHLNGTLRRTGSYDMGQEEGPWKLANESGTASEQGSFHRGKREGLWVERDSGHETRVEYVANERHGKLVEYHHGEKFREAEYRAGKLHGTSTRTWPSGQKCIETYVDGDRRDMTCWLPDGRKEVSTWKAGKKLGERTWIRGRLVK